MPTRVQGEASDGLLREMEKPRSNACPLPLLKWRERGGFTYIRPQRLCLQGALQGCVEFDSQPEPHERKIAMAFELVFWLLVCAPAIIGGAIGMKAK